MKNNNIKILEIVKYYSPSKGGMESFVKLLVDNLISSNNNFFINVYTVNHIISSKNHILEIDRIKIIVNKCFLFFKSQPIKFYFSDLKEKLEYSDIIHHHFPVPNIEIWLLFYYKIIQKKTFIITWHANIENTRWGFLNLFYKPIINKLLQFADYIVVTSPALLENSIILKKYTSKVKVIPLSFDKDNYVCDFKTLTNNPIKKVLFVGKLREYKGVQFLIKAINFFSASGFLIRDLCYFINSRYCSFGSIFILF